MSDSPEISTANSLSSESESTPEASTQPTPTHSPLMMVETAFLASAASLIWFINYYFPLGPLLRVFFPLPIALLYLRWGKREAYMGALTAGLLLTVLMGPTRSILYVVPYAWIGIILGQLWRRQAQWWVSVGIASIIGTFGFFFRYWLLSILLGRDLWGYTISQITELAEWIFIKLGILAAPSLTLIQALAIAMVFINNVVYLFVVHLVALLLLDRLKSPIPRPPKWVQVLLDYEE